MDVNNNLPVAVDGDQAIIGTDVYTSSGVTAHAQVMKIAWGNDATVTRATTTTPLPVQVYGLTGTLSTVTVTGSVRGLGSFTVGTTYTSPLHVTGGINAFVFGVTGATPVTVTGGVSILSNIGITGTVNVTGGRPLTQATDSITVGGTVSRNWNLSNATDNVKVYASDSGLTLPVKIVAADGTIIGASGNALNVNVVGAGISANVTISSTIQVENSANILRVQGTTNGTALPITGSVSFINGSEITVANNPLLIDTQFSGVSYAGEVEWPSATNNIEKLLSFYENSNLYTIPWYLKDIRSDLTIQGLTGSIGKRINELVTDGSTNRNASFVGVRTFNSTRNPIKTWRVTVNSNTAVLLDSGPYTNNIKHGVTIKNISTTNSVMIGAGVFSPTTPTVWAAPTLDSQFGIHLSPMESIFIPSSIFVSFLVEDAIPPLYGKIVESNISSATIISIMAV